MFRCGAQRLFQIGSQQILLLIFGAVTLCLIINLAPEYPVALGSVRRELHGSYFMPESCQQLMPLEKPRSVPRVAFSTVAGVNL